MERRHFLQVLGGLGAVGALAGCSGNKMAFLNPGSAVTRQKSAEADDGICLDETPAGLLHATESGFAPAVIAAPSLAMVARSSWGADQPIRSRLNAMTHVKCMTVHHEGCPRANWNASAGDVAKNLRQIQDAHCRRMRAGDIGYHFVIDRSGRIWEGRNLAYQGAHTRGHNEGNVGVMCLGNFDLQRPTEAQLHALEQLSATVLTHYRISPTAVYGHSDLVATRCPGRYLKPQVKTMRWELARA